MEHKIGNGAIDGADEQADGAAPLAGDQDKSGELAPLYEKVEQALIKDRPTAALLAALSPDTTNALIQRASVAAASQLVGARTNISLASQNAPAAFANTGNYAGVMPGPEAFASVYGVDEGRRQFARFDQNVKAGKQAFDMRAMSDQEIHDQLVNAAVNAGHSQDAQSGYQITAAAAQQVLEARRNDPAGEVGKALPEVNAAWRAVSDQGGRDPATVQKALALTVAAQQHLGVENLQPVPQSVLKDLSGLPRQDIQARMDGLLAGTADPGVKLAMSRQFAAAGLLDRPAQAPRADRFGRDDRRFGQDDGSDHEQAYDSDGLTEKASDASQLTPDERIGQSSQEDLPTDVLLANLAPGVFGSLVQPARGLNEESLTNTGANVESVSSATRGAEHSVATFGVEEGGKQYEPFGEKANNFAADILAAKGHPKQFANAFYRAGLNAGLTDTQARLMAAQATLESGSGKRAPGFNYFGVKAFKSWKGATQHLWTHENEHGQLVRRKLRFRKYATLEEGIRDRIAVMKHNFPEANDATDIESALVELQRERPRGQHRPYATDSKYALKLRPFLKLLPQ
ncbi:glucosaminidase domain-containing protein [Mesorhizobium carmichaelinearum]|uniref:glucosaminidase domain-containing protein n=1 Tax=Mesorhizobium carmichaelinearum TaxID=1208188 RepID=UPI000BA47D99|nr:glucosaminidase domain-containing protein [Mesorhizobium carmichaelinearum]